MTICSGSVAAAIARSRDFLEWTRSAENDLIEILDYIAADDPTAALATLDRIEAASLRLTELPRSGREGSVPETRELPIPGLPRRIRPSRDEACGP